MSIIANLRLKIKKKAQKQVTAAFEPLWAFTPGYFFLLLWRNRSGFGTGRRFVLAL